MESYTRSSSNSEPILGPKTVGDHSLWLIGNQQYVMSNLKLKLRVDFWKETIRYKTFPSRKLLYGYPW